MAMPPWVWAPYPPTLIAPATEADVGAHEDAREQLARSPELLPPLGRWWFLEADVLVVTAALLCVGVLGIVAMAVAR